VALYQQLAEEHLRRLARVSERGSVARLRRLYQSALDEMERDVRRVSRGAMKDSFTAHHRRMILLQLRQGVRLMSQRLSLSTVDFAREAAADARGATFKNIVRLEQEFSGTTPVLPVEEAVRFIAAPTPGQTTSLLRDASGHGLLPGRVQTSMARYGARLVTAFEQDMSKSLLLGETVGQAIDRLRDTGNLEWWQAERIARTETAWAYAAATMEAAEAAREELPDLELRWTEYVSDSTGAPLDNRVAADSLALHGQLPAHGVYTLPLDGRQYSHPPNRPNDRSVLQPWRPHWRVPAWRWNGRRVSA
jgi:hypothetical protein